MKDRIQIEEAELLKIREKSPTKKLDEINDILTENTRINLIQRYNEAHIELIKRFRKEVNYAEISKDQLEDEYINSLLKNKEKSSLVIKKQPFWFKKKEVSLFVDTSLNLSLIH